MRNGPSRNSALERRRRLGWVGSKHTNCRLVPDAVAVPVIWETPDLLSASGQLASPASLDRRSRLGIHVLSLAGIGRRGEYPGRRIYYPRSRPIRCWDPMLVQSGASLIPMVHISSIWKSSKQWNRENLRAEQVLKFGIRERRFSERNTRSRAGLAAESSPGPDRPLLIEPGHDISRQDLEQKCTTSPTVHA